MMKTRKKQLVILSINILILLAVFGALFIYDNYFREPPVIYKRPIIEMEKISDGDNPLFENYDRAELFAQYKGTRAVGSENPDKMVFLVTHPGYEQNFHFSHLLYEAYKLQYGLVILDFKGIKNFVPIRDNQGEIFENNDRKILYISTMMEYMKLYGFESFRIVYLGLKADESVSMRFSDYGVSSVPGAPLAIKTPLSMAEEASIIEYIFNF